MERLTRILTAVAAAFLCAGVSEAARCIGNEESVTVTVAASGDVNADEMIDARDATLILEEYSVVSIGGVSGFTVKQLESADVNGDGKADSIDASYILSYYSFISTGGNKTFTDFIKKEY
ncbi:MAG: hypothetical protein IKJ87_05445 [Ruminococcus sp.]|nr:hypothetical protein [Ruminococcus sp.]